MRLSPKLMGNKIKVSSLGRECHWCAVSALKSKTISGGDKLRKLSGMVRGGKIVRPSE